MLLGRGHHKDPIYDFNGQIAIVSGASSGSGLATAQAFAEAGAAVALLVDGGYTAR